MEFLFLLILLGLGFSFGRCAERSHYRSILLRERLYRQLVVVPLRTPPPMEPPPRTQLVSGNVVISIDFFKQFIARIRMLFGGRLTSYDSLLDRARREAVLRVKEDAKRLGATAIYNLKLETAAISRGERGDIGSVEVYAYGTAIIPVTSPASAERSRAFAAVEPV